MKVMVVEGGRGQRREDVAGAKEDVGNEGARHA